MILYNKLSEIKEHAKNHDLSECAEKFDVSKPYMSKFCCMYNIHPVKRYCGGASESELRELVEKYTDEEICEKLNISKNRLYSTLYYLHIKIKNKRNRPYGKHATRNEIIIYALQKYTCEAVAEAFGITAQRVSEIRKLYEKGVENECTE